MRLARIFHALVLLLVVLGCGVETPKNVTVTIEPASATIPVGTVLELRGNATGFTDTPLVGWWVEETTRSTYYCGTDYDERPPDSTSCPCGYVMFNKSDTGVPSRAYYHAPSVARTCHVRFEAIQYYNYEVKAMQNARAEYTVTP